MPEDSYVLEYFRWVHKRSAISGIYKHRTLAALQMHKIPRPKNQKEKKRKIKSFDWIYTRQSL
jgi:hypothetical protein